MKRIYSPKSLAIFFSLLFAANNSFAQADNNLTLDSCFVMAKRNYPLVKQMALVDQAKEYSIENANKSYLPTIVVNGQASYQSQVTELPIKIPNLTLPSLNKDQYKIYGEINQPITDLFNVKNQKEQININAEIESQRNEVELYKLNERITNLYFGILLIDAQLRQTEILKADIQAGLDKTKAAIDNGAALKSNANILKAEMLKADQRSVELESNRKAYCEMLTLFINQNVDELTHLQAPASLTQSNEVKRPELKLYELQKQTFETQKKLLNARYLPKAGLFLQGGFGRPALNMLSNAFEPYYIGGLRLNWNITGYYTLKKEKKILDINQSSTDLQSQTFLFNTKLSMSQQNREIRKYEELITSDNEIVGLRESIKNTSKEQLQYGTITANDYITYVNAEDQARQEFSFSSDAIVTGSILISKHNRKLINQNMKRISFIIFVASFIVLFSSCNGKKNNYDASGTFEAEETIISAEASGNLKQFNLEEGQTLQQGQEVGYIDSIQLSLKKKQLEAQINALLSKKPNVSAQLAALQEQLKTAQNEQRRIANMAKADAATQKQLDDINGQVEVIRRQIDAQKSTLDIATEGIGKDVTPLSVQIDQLNDQIQKCKIVNPINGTILTKYAEANEVTAAGKPLYKIADLTSINLRAYISGNQLPLIKLNQKVKVLTDDGKGGYKETEGVITWINDKAEFTPKTILTKEERVNTVYAMKIKVANDGTYKIGMYGEVKFQ